MQILKTMRYTFLIVITLKPLLLFGQVPSGIDTNYGYEKYLKAKYDSVDNLLNKYYKEWISFDSTGILRESQRAWIKYRDLNTTLINSENSIPYSNSQQVKYQVLYNMTDFRLNELKSLFWRTQYDRTFKTNGMVKEIFFPKDIVNIIPSIKNSSNKSDLVVKNINPLLA